MKAFFFIDPGAKGGMAIALGSMDKLKTMNLEGIGQLQETLEEHECYDRKIVMEQVPPFAGKNVPSHTSFKLGRSCGLLEGLAIGMKLPCWMVRPQDWQRGLSGLKGLSGNPRKRVLKEHAQRLYPEAKPTLRTADAILIGHHFFNTNH